MQITKDVLIDLGVSPANADRHLEPLNDAMGRHGIDTPLRIAHFLAQVVHESAHLKAVSENLNYSAEGLLKIFKKYFKTPAQAQSYARKPEKIANRVYAGRMGNGDEASGDGYRYRGRGLIQLTGKNNYRAFSTWVGYDCVADPDQVAGAYAALSGVFYWDANGLNALADTDNLVAMTKRINGGLNGFADRRELLQKAKRALRRLPAGPASAAVTPPPETAPVGARVETGFAPTHRVAAAALNLRSKPDTRPSSRIASLPQDTRVEQLGEAAAPGWVSVRTMLNGVLREGLVSARYLAPLPQGGAAFAIATEVLIDIALPPARMTAGGPEITRLRDGGRLYPLGEAGRPGVSASNPAAQVEQLLAIVAWLDCENPGHLRYQAKAGANHASTYVGDYCDLAGVYLPRVWWTGPALARIAQEQRVELAYDRTVRELSTNGLFDWLSDHGTDFGWHREVDLIMLQEAANAGEVCLIVAKSRDLDRAGHIVAVVPEHAGCRARRDKDGDVLRPAESHCAARNVRCATARTAWWLSAKYRDHAFWRHPLGEADSV